MNNLVVTLGITLEKNNLVLSLVEFSPEIRQLTGNWFQHSMQVTHVEGSALPDIQPELGHVINRFLTQADVKSGAIDRVVIGLGDMVYAYPNFEIAVRTLSSKFEELFAAEQLFFARCDGHLIDLESLKAISSDEAPIYICTAFVGSGYLGTKLMKNGIVLDMGDYITRIIPIVDYQLDPDVKNDPPNYLQHAYASGKRIYIGMQTPIREVITEFTTVTSRYHVCPTDLKVGTLCRILDLADANEQGISMGEQQVMDNQLLAASVGLDASLLATEECIRIARSLFRAVLQKIVDAVEHVIKISRLPSSKRLRALILGGDYPLLPKMALSVCHFQDENMVMLKSSHYWQHWSSAGASYGLALMAAEKISNMTLELEYETFGDWED